MFSPHSEELVLFRMIACGKGGVNRELPRQAVSTVKCSPCQSTLDDVNVLPIGS
jgi:hypothetical protein